MEELSRPAPVRGIPERIRDWIEWFGLARLVSSAVAVVIVCVGAYWLVRTPPPPTEASLPMVTAVAADAADAAAAGAPSSTLLLPPPPDDGAAAPRPLTVHVAGAVVAPGVYGLVEGDRVHIAIERAGGVTSDGDLDALNLAAAVVDGTRIYVPSVGEAVSSLPLIAVDDATGPTAIIDINRATAAELQTLPGVGPATATAIVTERDRNGPFLGVDDLERVPGIGPAKLAALRGLVTT